MRKRKIRLAVSPSLHMLFIHPLKGPLRLLLPPRLNPRLWDSTTTERTTNARSNAIKNFFMSRLLRMERMNLERLSRLAFSKQPLTDQITPDLPRNHFLPAESTKCKRTLPSTSEIKFSTLLIVSDPKEMTLPVFGFRNERKFRRFCNTFSRQSLFQLIASSLLLFLFVVVVLVS